MALDLQRLLSVARGEISPTTALTGVGALVTPSLTTKKPGITPITPLTCQKTKLPKRAILDVINGVTDHFDAPHAIQKSCCICGNSHAPFGVMFNWREPDNARWYCPNHYRKAGQ